MSGPPRDEATAAEPAWEERVEQIWSSSHQRDAASLLGAIKALTDQRAPDDPVALFEQASAFDSTGHPDRAVALYQRALAGGLSGPRRRRATIQMASSLRNLGRPSESVALLHEELAAPSDELDDAVRAFLALALVDVGHEREAVALALTALARHLPRYQRSLANYAREIAGS